MLLGQNPNRIPALAKGKKMRKALLITCCGGFCLLASILYNGPDPATAQSAAATAELAPDGMVKIKAGCYMMGSDYGPEDELPIHEVCLDAFFMDTHEVTLGEYEKCAAVKRTGMTDADRAKGCDPPEYSGYDKKKPAVGVNWHQAVKYCKWLGKRLPTEAEWEYAARGGLQGKLYPWGDEEVEIKSGARTGANYGRGAEDFGNADPVTKTGSFQANGYGLYDMAGNVWEWVSDWNNPGYYKKSPKKNPQGPTGGEKKSLRGGSWMSSGLESLRVSDRAELDPNYGLPEDGFRCAK
jgi:formylglycine-generating enzyme required for sulfatase activity